jgi:hypothetical protein
MEGCTKAQYFDGAVQFGTTVTCQPFSLPSRELGKGTAAVGHRHHLYVDAA